MQLLSTLLQRAQRLVEAFASGIQFELAQTLLDVRFAPSFFLFRGHLTAPATNPVALTLFVNGSATGVTCTISAPASGCVDAADTATLAAGDVVSVRITIAGGRVPKFSAGAGLKSTVKG